MTEPSVEIMNEKLTQACPDWGKDYGLSQLWTEVLPNLWVGGTADDDTVLQPREGWETMWAGMQVTDDAAITKEEFDAVVTLYAWARPVDWFVEELRWGIYDGGNEAPDIEAVKDVVVWAHKRWAAGKKTLIRCQAGLSRSTFITALVLVRSGMNLEDAIKLIRDKRSPKCLNVNGSAKEGAFTKIMLNTPEEYWRS